MAIKSILDTIGDTPLVQLRKMTDRHVFGKAEFLNPGGSIKDRVARHLLREAQRTGELQPDSIIVEATSGNTGIGMTLVGVQLGYRVIIVMPENMSEERKKIIKAFGGELLLTPAGLSIAGAVEKALELQANDKRVYIPQQFENPRNPEIHYRETAPEIWRDLDGKIDLFVAGIGSGGTLAGVGKFLKERNPKVQLVAVEPSGRSALLGHEPGLHQIQGIGDGFIPKVLDVKLIDHVITITDEDAIETTRKLAREEGLLVGTSSGANVSAAIRAAHAFGQAGANVVTILVDRAERYFSTALL